MRPNNWEGQISIQREILPRISAYAGYTRRWYGNLFATRNLAVTNADYTPYCVNLPTDPRLPGSGTQQCGYFDVNRNRETTTEISLSAASSCVRSATRRSSTCCVCLSSVMS